MLSVAAFSPGSWTGLYICKRGRTSGENCGIIVTAVFATTYGDGVFLFPMARAIVYSGGGDSGGPLFSGNTGYGLTSGVKVTSNGCGFETTFQPLQLGTVGLGLHLL